MNKSTNTFLIPKQTIKVKIYKVLDYFQLPLFLIVGALVFGLLYLFVSTTAIGVASGLLLIPVIILYYFYSPFKSKIAYIGILYLIGIVCSVLLYLYLSNNPYKNVLSNYYEGFQTNQSNITPNIIRKKTIDLQKALDKLEILSEDTCVVLNSIESKFMDNATVPQSDESNLSETTKQSMKEKRINKAKQDWINKKLDYSKDVGKECFIDSSQDSSDLQEAIKELKDLLTSPSVMNLDNKLNNLNVTNKFSIMYSDKFAKEATNVLNVSESFQTSLSNDPTSLIKQADEIIQKIQKADELVQQAKKASNTVSNLTRNPNTIANILTS